MNLKEVREASETPMSATYASGLPGFRHKTISCISITKQAYVGTTQVCNIPDPQLSDSYKGEGISKLQTNSILLFYV